MSYIGCENFSEWNLESGSEYLNTTGSGDFERDSAACWCIPTILPAKKLKCPMIKKKS